MSKRVTIHDLAKAANCSIATISIALNGLGRISPAKRREIQKLAQTMKYQPNDAGRNLRRRRTDTIGLMFNPAPSSIFRNIFYADVMKGLEDTLYKKGYNLLLGSGRDGLAEGEIPKFLSRGSTDALILLGHFPDSELELLLTTTTPVLLLDSASEAVSIDSLTSDGYNGISQAMDHLFALGHRRIGMLAYDGPDYNIANRLKGFHASITRLRLLPQDCPTVNQFKYNEEIHDILPKIMRGKRRPTAFICVNDTLAQYAATFLQGKGLSVPDDVSIVGFDDDLFAKDNVPPLTTLQIDRERIGRVGGDMVFDRLNEPDGPISKAILPVKLITRKSTSAPPRSVA